MNDKKYTSFDNWIKEIYGPDGSDMYSKMARKWAKKAWLAAKEKYGPRWIPVSERLPEPFVHVALIDAERHQNCPDVMNGRDHIKDIGYYNPEWKCWSVRGQPGFSKQAYTHWLPLPPVPSAHSTQGGGE